MSNETAQPEAPTPEMQQRLRRCLNEVAGRHMGIALFTPRVGSIFEGGFHDAVEECVAALKAAYPQSLSQFTDALESDLRTKLTDAGNPVPHSDRIVDTSDFETQLTYLNEKIYGPGLDVVDEYQFARVVAILPDAYDQAYKVLAARPMGPA